jgi:hypothetical protein
METRVSPFWVTFPCGKCGDFIVIPVFFNKNEDLSTGMTE